MWTTMRIRSTLLLVSLAVLSGCGDQQDSSGPALTGVSAECLTVPELPQKRIQRSFTAESTQPECDSTDPSCRAWREYRSDHPYPYQAFAGKRLANGKATLVISEPPPEISHSDAIEMVKGVFSDRNPSIDTKRWKIISDGYVEDIVVSFDAPELNQDDVLSSPAIKDRIAALQLAWYGTTCGGDVETIGDGSALKQGVAPNLKVTAAEVKNWMSDPNTLWTPIEDFAPAAQTWPGLAAASVTGAFISQDKQLVLLGFPKSVLDDPAQLDAMKPAFRRFATSSDSIISVIWNDAGELAIIGRGRTHPLSQIPPLRFETFKLLVTQTSDNLAQSYERGSALAGPTGPNSPDWAPIYLSDPLIDTEFGNLLNVTDQMLKSWSEAGTVSYLNFNYPLRPKTFPFGEKPLSDLVYETTKSLETLFNWNTSGSAVSVTDGDTTIFVARQLGSLPITYGSDRGTPGEMKTGHLVQFEDKAYTYFSGLGDPNLARVVQYTLLYQAVRNFRGKSSDNESAPVSMGMRPETLAVAKQVEALLSPAERGRWGEQYQNVSSALDDFRKACPNFDDATIALLLTDRNRGLKYVAANGHSELYSDNTALENLQVHMSILGSAFQRAVWQSKDINLESVRATFEKESARSITGWSRTPSNVISHGNSRLIILPNGGIEIKDAGVGGHNLDAIARRIESSADTQGIEATEDGRIIYNPDRIEKVEAHAAELARAVEHRHATPTELQAILDSPVNARTRWQALGLDAPKNGELPQVARLGGRAFNETGPLVENLKRIKSQLTCCRVAARDEAGRMFIVENSPKPPPLIRVLGFGDTPSMGSYFRRGGGKPNDMIVLNQDASSVEAMLAGVDAAQRPTDFIASLRTRYSRWKGRRDIRGDNLVTDDLEGESGVLTTPEDNANAAGGFDRLNAFDKQTGKVLRVEAVHPDDIARLAQSLAWNPSADGIPTAVRIRFDPAKSSGYESLDVVAGIHRNNGGILAATVAKSFESHIGSDISIAAAQLSVRKTLRQIPEGGIGRIVFVLHRQGAAATTFTMNVSKRSIAGV